MSNDVLRRFRALDADPAPPAPFGELVPPNLPPSPPHPGGHRSKRLAAGLAAAAAIATAVVIGLPASDEGDRHGIVPPALLVASAAAADSTVEGIGYSRSTTLTLAGSGSLEGGPYSVRLPKVTESWVREDGSGRLRTYALAGDWPGPRDRERAIAAEDDVALAWVDGKRLPEASDELLSADELDGAVAGVDLPPSSSLSSDPDELREQLMAFDRSEGRVPEDVALFELATNLLLKPNVAGPARAAGFEVVGGLAGIEVESAVNDPLGRSSTSVSLTSDHIGDATTQTLFFDPESSRVLAYTVKLVEPANHIDSRLLSSTLVTDVRTVDSIPDPVG